ncbi:hypothetical protein N658DRAFT_308235 [Parathielavia hyrcaniae]|uniref:Uncharacterized protein n=1 Tax=Parathielavia hyrcaniae TaxID=113614 RepID=A0AAN6Q4C3_9PEZI|nr:hypothetical protein N658DRAFT_308235 [Parathielavia hyrcaniae]
MDETNPVTLESGDPRRQHEHDKSKQSIRSLFEDANLCAAVRCFFSFPMLASAIYILATYPRPAPNPAVVSFASYSLGCAISHIISLVTHRITRPPSPTSALPLRGYIVGLVVSPVLLSVAVVFGLVVVALTKGYHGQHHHQPFKVEVVAFDLTIVCVSFAFAAL